MANLFLQGSFTWYQDGTVALHQYPNVRTPTFFSTIPDFHHLISADDGDVVPFNFRGGFISLHTAGPRNISISHSPNLQFTRGRLTFATNLSPAVGALTEFAVWDSTSPDPRDAYVQTATANNTGNIGSTATRHSAVFALPSTARYVGVGAKFIGMPGTGTPKRYQHVKKIQLEKAPLGGSYPTPYTEAREIETVVHPDRLNWSVNPSFWVDTANWTGLTRVANSLSSSGFVGSFTSGGSGTTVVTHVFPKLYAGKTYLVRTRVQASDIAQVVQSVTGAALVQKIDVTAHAAPELAVMSITPMVTGAVTVTYTVSYAIGVTVNFYHMLAEKTTALTATYFDGSTSGDHVWEQGGTTGATRSYYYKNRAERYAALMRALTDHTPMGIGIGLPQFGVLPKEVDTY